MLTADTQHRIKLNNTHNNQRHTTSIVRFLFLNSCMQYLCIICHRHATISRTLLSWWWLVCARLYCVSEKKIFDKKKQQKPNAIAAIGRVEKKLNWMNKAMSSALSVYFRSFNFIYLFYHVEMPLHLICVFVCMWFFFFVIVVPSLSLSINVRRCLWIHIVMLIACCLWRWLIRLAFKRSSSFLDAII